MNSWLFSLLGAPAGGGGDASAGSLVSTLIPFILIIGIFYFLIIRPQNKKQKETQNMLKALKKGDKIVTIGGIHGTIQSVKESSVIVRVDDNTKLEFSRSAISGVENSAKEEKAEKSDDKKTENLLADKGNDAGDEAKN
ncbi:MAG: preprotein translocase subunit YajC [Treponema sp.]|jgi:preprotein translocase subunit YajC|nr:preprotein translocase subunit YajC [Treponema sp.]